MVSPKPAWLRKRLSINHQTRQIEQDLRANRLHTICQEACCPNRGECFSRGVATFLIMGNVCTRNCTFCAVASGNPQPLDPDEPERVALEVRALGLHFVVITSVTRDDLPDGGANHFVRVIQAIREKCKGVGIEVLIPDFQGCVPALSDLVRASPEVINHNIETVPRLYFEVRPQADYRRSLELLKGIKEIDSRLITKSGLMVGLGETEGEVEQVMVNLRNVECDALTVGQYLSPSRSHHPVVEYIPPATFEKYRKTALQMGFKSVASGPFVRSSYLAETYYNESFVSRA
jgi:lipoic acid synthetase